MKDFEERVEQLRVRCSAESGVNSFAMLFEDGHQSVHAPAQCYGSLAIKNYAEGSDCIAFIDAPFKRVFTHYPKGEEAQKDLYAYYNWVIRDSVWRRAFKTKNVDDVIENGMVFDVSRPTRYILQAGILLRHPGEYNHVPRMWRVFQEFCDPHVALILGMDHVSWNLKEEILGFYQGTPNEGGHVPFLSYDISVKTLKNWVKKNVRLPQSGHIMSKNTSYDIEVDGLDYPVGTTKYWDGDLEIYWKYPDFGHHQHSYEVFGKKKQTKYIPLEAVPEYVEHFHEINDLGDIYVKKVHN